MRRGDTAQGPSIPSLPELVLIPLLHPHSHSPPPPRIPKPGIKPGIKPREGFGGPQDRAWHSCSPLTPCLGIPNPSTITYNIQRDFTQRGFLLESSSGRCPGLGTQGRKERSQGSIPGKAPNAAWLYLGQRRHGRCSRAH